MRTLSLDLRERILSAYDKKEGTREEIAARFRVSLGMVKKLLQQRRRTGNIAPVALGMNRQELAELFGPPDDHSAGISERRSPIWKYGTLEFHFENDGALWLIYMDTPDAAVVSLPRLAR